MNASEEVSRCGVDLPGSNLPGNSFSMGSIDFPAESREVCKPIHFFGLQNLYFTFHSLNGVHMPLI